MSADVLGFIRKKSQEKQASVFTATIAGDKCVFIADPEYVTIPFRPKFSKYLDGLSLQKQFSRTVLDCNNSEVDENFGKDITKVDHSLYHTYLFKNEHLEESIAKVNTIFHRLVPALADQDNHSWKQHNLFDIVVRTVFKATMGPFLSADLVSDDEIYDQFHIFDKGVIPLFNSAPNFLTEAARSARSFLQCRIGSKHFWDEASPLMMARKQAFANHALSPGALHKTNLGLLWASVGNTAPAVFWTLLLLLNDKNAWNACKTQMDDVVAKRKTPSDVFTLQELDEMKFLESSFKEALRLYQGNFTTRKVVQDFVLAAREQKYIIEKGSNLMIWWGVLHRDPGVFGQNADSFQYDRFVNKTKEDFSYQNGHPLTHEPIMAFGGGSQYCPGRKFASYETRLYLAMLMQSFDIKLVEGETIPGIDPAMVGIGVCHPARDVKVQIRSKVDQCAEPMQQ